jgi:hypothetical protein
LLLLMVVVVVVVVVVQGDAYVFSFREASGRTFAPSQQIMTQGSGNFQAHVDAPIDVDLHLSIQLQLDISIHAPTSTNRVR